MKSKAPLVMMEQIVMVLVFALSAALCLQTFVLSGRISKKTEEKNRAVAEAQNVAETMKAGGFSMYLEVYNPEQTGDTRTTFFSEEWQTVEDKNAAEYVLSVSYKESDTLSLWQAEIIMSTAEGEELIRIPAAGQTEVAGNE